VLRGKLSLCSILATSTMTLGCGEDHDAVDLGDDARALPDTEYCDPARDWDAAHGELEAQMLERIEAHRSTGADCGDYGRFRPAGSLAQDGALRCAARVHALDMHMQGYVAHLNTDEETAADRVARAGGRFLTLAETIAAGQASSDRVVDEIWIGSAGSCATLMGDAYTAIGVGGFVDDDGFGWWTVVIAR
jgi:uncharacterized protein YkwD